MTSRQLALALITILTLTPALTAQNPDHQAMQPIHQLFESMRNRDSAAARAVFHPDARVVSLPAEVGEFAVDEPGVDALVERIGAEREDWDERIWDWEVRVDGNLATVWTPYAFYRGGVFSHCGVDSFQLAETPEGWKILSLVYSRRVEGCEEPQP